MALLHYWGHDGHWQSEIQDTMFFLDPEGPTNPEYEWEAHRQAFLTPMPNRPSDDLAQCRFPARFALMKQALGWSDHHTPPVDCPDLSMHKQTLNAKSLSVVFVSHYLNNPASAFGHIMLYFGSDSGHTTALSDHSVSFEANTEGLSPLEYLPRGLFGGLIAQYRVAPLHERVRRYEREEQRDLWVFPLKFSQDQIDQLVLHVWELKDVTYRYGFFGANCAQKILSLVHAVAPEYKLLPHRRFLAVLPSEVGKRLVDHIGLSGPPIQRPSLWGQYTNQVTLLSPAERVQLDNMLVQRIVIDSASPATLSAALLWSEFQTPDRAFRRAAEGDTESHRDLVWRRALWASRIANGGDSSAAPLNRFSAGPSILQGHRPSLLSVRGGYRRGTGSAISASARWLLHGAVDPYVGYPPASTLEVARIDFAFGTTGKFHLDEATAIRIERLAPGSGLQSAIAWKFDLGARRVAYNGGTPLHLGLEVGVGLGAGIVRSQYLVAVYSMIGVRPGAAFDNGGVSFLPAGILSGGVLVRLPAGFRTRLSGEYSISIGTFGGGAAAFTAVARKGLTQNWDVEFLTSVGPNKLNAAIGFVSFH